MANRRAKLTPGEIVEIPYYCFAPMRSGWNGWLFTPAQVIKVLGKNKYGRRVALLDVCDPNGKHGESYEKNVCEDRIFAYPGLVANTQRFVLAHSESEMCKGRYSTETYWLADKGLVTGLH